MDMQLVAEERTFTITRGKLTLMNSSTRGKLDSPASSAMMIQKHAFIFLNK